MKDEISIPGVVFRPGQRVRVKDRYGTVKYVGNTQFAPNLWIGIELDINEGKNDGSVNGVRYFKCRQKHGVFVRPVYVTLSNEDDKHLENLHIYVNEATQILKILSRHSLPLPQRSLDLITSLHSSATSLPTTSETSLHVPSSPPTSHKSPTQAPPIPAFALIYGNGEYTAKAARKAALRYSSPSPPPAPFFDESSSPPPARGNKSPPRRSSSPTPIFDESPSSSSPPMKPKRLNVSDQHAGEKGEDGGMRKRRSPSPSPTSNSPSHPSSLASSSDIPPTVDGISPLPLGKNGGKKPSPLGQSSSEPTGEGEERLPHLQKKGQSSGSLSILSPTQSSPPSAQPLSQSPPPMGKPPTVKRINTIVVTPVISELTGNGSSRGMPSAGSAGGEVKRRLGSGRVSTARRTAIARDQHLIAKDRRTLAAMQLQRTRSNITLPILEQYRNLIELGKTLTAKLEKSDVIQHIMVQAKHLLAADRCSLFLVDRENQELVSQYADGEEKIIRFSMSGGIAGHVACTGEILNITDAYSHPKFNSEIDKTTGYVTETILCMPVVFEDQIVAVAELINKSNGPFSKEDEEVFAAFAAFAGVSIHNSMLYEQNSKHDKQTKALLDVARSLAEQDLNTNAIVSTIMQQARELVDADRCALFLVDRDKGELISHIADQTAEIRFSMDAGIAGHVATTGEVINTAQAYDNPKFNPEIDKKSGYKTQTILCMPVFYENTIVAVAELINKRNGAFTKEDEQSFSAFAIFAGVSLRKAYLYETSLDRERRNQILLEVASNLASQPLDTNILVSTIMDQARNLLNADRCTLFLVDRTSNKLVSQIADGTAQITIGLDEGIAGHVVKTGKNLNITDAYANEFFNPEVDKTTGYKTRTILCMPVKYENSIVAVAQLINKKGTVFSEKDENVFAAFAVFAGVTLRNAKMYETVVKNKEQTQIMLEAAMALSSDSELTPLIKSIMQLAKRLVDVERFSVYAVDRTSNKLFSQVSEGFTPREVGSTVAEHVANSGKEVILPDAYMEQLLSTEAKEFNTRSLLCTPVKDVDGNVIAVAEMVNKRKGVFGPEDKELLKAFAVYCGTTLEEGKAKEQDASLASDVAFYQAMSVPQDELSVLRTFDFDVHKTAADSTTAEMLIPFLFQMFDSLGLLERFNIPHSVLYQFLIAVRRKYHSNVPYHNFAHAFDVTQTVFAYIYMGKLQELLDDIDIFVLMVSALCHDMDHMGVNNAFHSKAETPLGLLYTASGAGSVLETHHCSVAIAILSDPRFNIFGGLDEVSNKMVWNMLINAILATDMAKHGEICRKFEAILGKFDRTDPEQRRLLAYMLLKCADISNVTKPFPVAKQWGMKLTEEFFAQGDKERLLWSNVTPFMDRTRQTLAHSQIGFISAVAQPVFALLARMRPTLKLPGEQLVVNKKMWEKIAAENAPPASPHTPHPPRV